MTAKASKTKKPSLGRFGLVWLIGLACLLVAALVVSSFDYTTVLAPTHDDDLSTSTYWAIAAALASVGVAIWQLKSVAVTGRVAAALGFGALGALAVFMAASQGARIIDGMIDFPAGKTQSSKGLLLISRSYHTHGKGRGWTIQTMPIWSNIEITQSDYNFMATHRPHTNGRIDPDEISSRGHFCADVTIQRSGAAMRVMHAGRSKLPPGSIVVCPPGTVVPSP